MAVGRITGPLLKANLLRNGIDLAFETDLLYLDVTNGRVGVKTSNPSNELSVNGTTKTTNLEVTTQADIATFTLVGNTLSSTSGTINLEPNGTNAVIYQGKIVTGDLQISENLIEVTALDSDLEIKTLGTGVVNVNSGMYVSGDLHVVGNITADGSIQIGDTNTDNIVFNADINSHITPDINSDGTTGYDLGSSTKEWRTAYVHDVVGVSNIVVDHLEVNGITFETTQGNIIYVAANGDDANAGLHENDPVASVKHALTLANAGDTVYIYPGTYTEVFPLVIQAGVTVKGAGLRAVMIQPTSGTNDKDAFLLNGETTIEDVTIANFFYNAVDNTGYALRFDTDFTVTTRSPYIRNVTVITRGTSADSLDPYGFDSDDAGKGALADGSVANSASKEASMLFHSVTFFTPNQETLIGTNGVRIEWLNSFTYFADKGIYLTNGTLGFASLGTKFGAELRSIGSACVYGNYGVYGDGDAVVGYIISHNFAYVGAGKLTTNDPNDRIAANEVTKLNDAQIYYTSVDNEGNFSVGDAFYVNQATGDVLFNGVQFTITAPSGVTFTDGVNSTTITATNIDTGNIRISGNTVESLSGDINVTADSGSINLQNNTFVTGNLDVTGDVHIGGNITIGDQTTDTINFIGGISSNLVPAATATYDLGDPSLRWDNVYVSRAEIDGVVIDNNSISTTVGNDNLTLSAAGSGQVYIPTNDVQIDQNLTVTTDLTVTTGTTYLKDTSVTGTLTQAGNINQTGDFTTSGLVDVTGNITATGYLELPVITISGNSIATTTTDTDLVLEANGTGNIVFEGLEVSNNAIQSTATNSDVTLTPQGTGSVIVNSNQSIIIPVGDTSERPASPTVGMIRYNTDLSRYEGWNGSYWITLGGVQDVDGNTKITAELTPGSNDNIIRFYVNGVLMATIDASKLFVERIQTNDLDIQNNTISAINTNSDINLTTSGTGGVRIGNLKVRANSITNVVSGAITEFVQSGTGYVKISGANGVVIPAGDTLNDRPLVPETGMIRFNTALQLVEIYNGITWVSVAGTSGGITISEATDLGIVSALLFG